MRTTKSNRLTNMKALVAGLAALALTDATVNAQTWQVTRAEVIVNGEAMADDHVVMGIDVQNCSTGPVPVALTAGFLGYDFAYKCYVQAIQKKFSPPQSVVDSELYNIATLDGVNTSIAHMHWIANSTVESASIDGYDATTILDYAYEVDLEITGGPVGTPVTVHLNWNAHAAAYTKHEMGGEDPSFTRNVVLEIDGVDQLGGNFDLGGPNPQGYWDLSNQTAQFNSTIGSTHTIRVSAHMESEIHMPGKGLYGMQDSSSAVYFGDVRLGVNVPPAPTPQPGPIQGTPEFSTDIGSDTDVGDPNLDGNGAFDPGDCYPWYGSLLPPCGADGIKDDSIIFGGFDWFPDAPSCVPQATGAPICSGMDPNDVALVSQWFDLDGHDNAGFQLSQFVYGPNQGRIGAFQDPCVHTARHLFVSFDDDGAGSYLGGPGVCSIPILDVSPNAGTIYGTTASQDEVVGVDTAPILPAPMLAIYPLLDEVSLHASLAPNPDAGNDQDDDADSLDILYSDADCAVWYFSADHEAPGVDPVSGAPFDPTAIYEIVPGAAPVLVADHTHLGVSAETDVDAFEFIWQTDQATGGAYLAVLFSVDNDDPLTFADESGGLDPAMLYVSYLDGASFPYLASPMTDDIDAVTAWSQSLFTNPQPPCDGDANADRVVDAADIAYVIFRLGNTGAPGSVDGDVDGNGIVDVGDISYVIFRLGTPCP